MLHRITHLKAPWPAGAVVGDTIELETVPGWAVGKCVPAEPGASATVAMEAQAAAPAAAEQPAAEPKARKAKA